jgi:hypothetical protein
MKYLAFAICVVAGMAAACWLVYAGHPWFALIVFLIVGGMSCSHDKESA